MRIDPVRLVALEYALDRSESDDAPAQIVRDAEVFESYLRAPLVVRTTSTQSGPWVLDGIEDPELRRAMTRGWTL